MRHLHRANPGAGNTVAGGLPALYDLGTVSISVADLFAASSQVNTILFDIRLPRILLAISWVQCSPVQVR